MRVRDLLSVPGLGLRLLTDVTGLDRAIEHVYTTDLLDPGRYLTPGDLVLTGMMWCREPGDAERFVTVLAKAGIAVLGAGEALGQVPPEVIQACGRHGVTLLAVPPETSFAVVTEEVGRRLNGDRVTAMSRVLGRRRRLLSAMAEGAGLDEMLGLMGREIGAECWLLTGTGRVVGGTGASLSRPLALQLACGYLKAERLPAVTEAVRGTPVRRGCTCMSIPCVTGSAGSRSLPGVICPRWMTRWISSWPCGFASADRYSLFCLDGGDTDRFGCGRAIGRGRPAGRLVRRLRGHHLPRDHRPGHRA